MPRIILSPAAEIGAVEIWAYIAEDNPPAADGLLQRLDKVCRTLAIEPQLGKPVPKLAPNLRFLPIGTYLIFYRPLEDGVEIVRNSAQCPRCNGRVLSRVRTEGIVDSRPPPLAESGFVLPRRGCFRRIGLRFAKCRASFASDHVSGLLSPTTPFPEIQIAFDQAAI